LRERERIGREGEERDNNKKTKNYMKTHYNKMDENTLF